MNLIKVTSSNVAAIGWSEEQGLVVEYHKGTRYAYKSVTDEIFQKILTAESVGKALHEHVIAPKDPFVILREKTIV